MQFFNNLSIRNKLLVIISTVTLITLTVAIGIFFVDYRNDLHKEMQHTATIEAQLIGENCKTAIVFDDSQGAKNIVEGLHTQKDVTQALVFDKNNKLFAVYTTNKDTLLPDGWNQRDTSIFTRSQLHVYQTIMMDNQHKGYVYLLFSTENLNKKINKQFVILVVAGLLTLLLGILLAGLLQKNISRPITRLARATRHVSESGSYKMDLRINSRDEIGQLYNDFGNMLTQIEKRENIIRDSEERFRAMTESAFDAVIVLDGNGVVYFINTSAQQMFGYTTDDLQGKDYHRLFLSSVALGNFMQRIKSFNTTNTGQTIGELMEIVAQHSTGEQFPTEVSIASMHIKQQWHAIITVRDVTQRKQYEADLIKAKKQAEESDRLKTAFLANMSHEIRTPMNSIIGFSDLLRNSNLPDEKRNQFLGIIANNGKNLLNLLDDIIDVSKIESKQITIRKAPCNINNLFRELYLQFKQKRQTESLGFEVVMSIDESNDLHASIDASRVRQVLINLIGNAFKFTDHGYVELGYRINNNVAECFVRDTGVGIPPQKLEHIFSRFGQVDESLTRNKGGAGLGLTISRSLVELMGGTMRVESKEGQGSTFFFTLPLDNIQVTQNKAVAQNNTDKKLLWEDKTILVAEDELHNFMLIEEYLKPTGVKLIHVNNGKDAVAACKSNPAISMVLMDVNMPLMDGYEATRQIKEYKNSIPIVAQTAFAMVGEREKSIEAGCNDYISKPISDDELIAVVKKYLT